MCETLCYKIVYVDVPLPADLVSYFVNKNTITSEYLKKKKKLPQGDLNPLVEGSVVLVHAMKAYAGSGGISPLIPNLGTRCR